MLDNNTALQKTTLDEWVEIDKNYLSRYQYKQKLFAEHREETLQYLHVADEAAFEALYYLADFLPRRYPSMFTKTEDGIINLVTGDNWNLRRQSKTWDSYHPLQVMSLLSTEDWFILQTDPDGQTTRLNAGANCFPAGWRLRDRIGHSLWQIHAGIVPRYEENLAKSMDRYFLRIPASKPTMRLNYSLQCSSELFQISSHHNLEIGGLEQPLAIDQLHLRVERQYLQQLPKTKGLVFSIRTYITPITEVTRDKERAQALRTSVDSFFPKLAAYKSKPVWGKILADHIKEVLGD
jgi:dimethylamine monooxygenase subunit A